MADQAPIRVPKGTNQAEVDAALDLLKRTKVQRAKQRDKQKNDPIAAQKAKDRAEKLRVKDRIFVQKAKAQGITVSDKEVDAYLAKKAAKGAE